MFSLLSSWVSKNSLALHRRPSSRDSSLATLYLPPTFWKYQIANGAPTFRVLLVDSGLCITLTPLLGKTLSHCVPTSHLPRDLLLDFQMAIWRLLSSKKASLLAGFFFLFSTELIILSLFSEIHISSPCVFSSTPRCVEIYHISFISVSLECSRGSRMSCATQSIW